MDYHSETFDFNVTALTDEELLDRHRNQTEIARLKEIGLRQAAETQHIEAVEQEKRLKVSLPPLEGGVNSVLFRCKTRWYHQVVDVGHDYTIFEKGPHHISKFNQSIPKEVLIFWTRHQQIELFDYYEIFAGRRDTDSYLVGYIGTTCYLLACWNIKSPLRPFEEVMADAKLQYRNSLVGRFHRWFAIAA